MPYDDQRGRTNSFSETLVPPTGPLNIPPTGQGGGTINWSPNPTQGGATNAVNNQFLGGSGGFLQQGGSGGGFTNFSAYLLANPGGTGDLNPTPGAGGPGASGLDQALNNAYGLHNYNPPPPPPAGTDGGTPTTTGGATTSTGGGSTNWSPPATGGGTVTTGPTGGTGGGVGGHDDPNKLKF